MLQIVLAVILGIVVLVIAWNLLGTFCESGYGALYGERDILIRTADDKKDYRGHQNHYYNIDTIDLAAERLIA